MKNKDTEQFLSVIDAKTKTAILDSIAKNYGISPDEAYTEVTNTTEHLLDFLTEPIRSATKVLLARHGQVIAYSFSSANATAELQTISPKEIVGAKKPAEKRSFEVTMSREVTETLTVTVMAANEDEAKEMANKIADSGEMTWESGFHGGEHITVENVTENPPPSMSIDEWREMYKPIKKPGATGDEFASDFLHIADGKNLDIFKAVNPKCIWTLLDVGSEDPDEDTNGIGIRNVDELTTGLLLVNGANFEDHLNYFFITEVPFDDSNGATMQIDYKEI